MTHPYSALPDRQYWRRSAAAWRAGSLEGLYRPKFPVTPTTRIATGGSCFAQHVTRHLRRHGFAVLDAEPAPPLMDPARAAEYGYGLYSARYGNIYTARQLRHLIQASHGSRRIEEVWEQDGRFFDPMRPGVEPGGFASREELEAMRTAHYAAIRRIVREAEVFVFTLGLTEVWVNTREGHAYPTCPGTIAGRFDPALHGFRNLSFAEVMSDMQRVIGWWRRTNPAIRFLLTVSPVPLAATAEDRHVAVATAQSKAVLRAVAGELAAEHAHVDYFPSFEIVTSHLSPGEAFEADLRNVRAATVDRVMACFLAAHGVAAEAPPAVEGMATTPATAEEASAIAELAVVCEEAELDSARSA